MSLVQCIQDQIPYYKKLSSELNSEAIINNELNIARNERQHLEKAIETKRAEIANLEQNSKKEFREVRKVRHLSFRSAAATLSGKKKELVAKEEAKYQLAFENEQRSKRDLDQLQSRYDEALTKEEKLVVQKGHFDETKLQLESLFEQVFSIEDPNFPAEPQLKAEIANYREQRRTAKRDRGRFAEAEQALTTCLVEIKKVIRLLDTVVNYVPFEIFGGPIIDDEQVAYLDAAKKRIWEIQRLLNIARTVLPEIPYPQTLDVVSNNALLNMQISVTFVDALWKVKTTQCFGMLATVYRNVQNSLTWVKKYHEYTTGAIIRLDEAIESTKKNLENERKRIFDAVSAGYIDSSSGSSSSHQPGLPPFSSTNNNEPPPPVYEAPPAEHNENRLGLPPNDLPAIPNNLTPSTSFSNIPVSNSPLIPPANLVNVDPSVPPQPISPAIGDANTSLITTHPPHMHVNSPITPQYNNSNHQQQQNPYVSHNANNPFV